MAAREQHYRVHLELVEDLSWFHTAGMEEIDPKQFVMRHEALGSYWVLDASLADLILYEVERLGFERVRLNKVAPHPVWTLNARLGRSIYNCEQIVKVAVKRLAQNLGFKVKLRDIIATVGRGRVKAVFCLDTPVARRFRH